MRFLISGVCRKSCLALSLVVVSIACVMKADSKPKWPLMIAHRGAGDRDGRKPEASKAAFLYTGVATGASPTEALDDAPAGRASEARHRPSTQIPMGVAGTSTSPPPRTS